MEQLTNDEAVALIRKAHWFHKWEVLPGVVTPGRAAVNPGRQLDEQWRVPQNLSGKRVLDIGALDGPYAFELERRGASVIAVDIQSPDVTGFNTAKRVRGSKVEYIQGNVYELSRLVSGQFDLICFLGVYYHLKHPLLAFEQIHKLLADEGRLLVEGECLRTYAESGSQARSPLGKVAAWLRNAALVRQMAASELPITMFYPRSYKDDPYNWFVPNLACIRAWLDASAMELHGPQGFSADGGSQQRFWGTARKVKGARIEVDNPVW